MTDVYIISVNEERSQTLGLFPGVAYFRARLVRGGPWVGIKTEVVIDDAGVDTNDSHRLWIGGNEVPWERWGNGRMTLIGEPITEPEYNYTLKALDWDKVNLGHDERKPVDLMALPPVAPPTRSPVVIGAEPFTVAWSAVTDPKAWPKGAILGVDVAADTPEASALADAVLKPIDVECEE